MRSVTNSACRARGCCRRHRRVLRRAELRASTRSSPSPAAPRARRGAVAPRARDGPAACRQVRERRRDAGCACDVDAARDLVARRRRCRARAAATRGGSVLQRHDACYCLHRAERRNGHMDRRPSPDLAGPLQEAGLDRALAQRPTARSGTRRDVGAWPRAGRRGTSGGVTLTDDIRAGGRARRRRGAVRPHPRRRDRRLRADAARASRRRRPTSKAPTTRPARRSASSSTRSTSAAAGSRRSTSRTGCPASARWRPA